MTRLVVFLLAVVLAGTRSKRRTLSFVTCPIVRDTKSVPCWLAEHKGEIYYLGNQGGVAQDFYPPQLNHQVLVEGVIAEGPRVCGDVPLHPVKTSVLLEIDRELAIRFCLLRTALKHRRVRRIAALRSWVRSDEPGQQHAVLRLR